MEPADPRYVLPKRSLVGPALGVAGGLLVAVLVIARQCSAQAERDRAQRVAAELEREAITRRTPPPRPPPLPTTAPDAAPIEFELVRGDQRQDLSTQLVELGDRVLVLRRTPIWAWNGARMSLDHPSSMRAATTADGVLLATDDATAEATLVDDASPAADVLATLRATYVSTGRIESTKPTTITLLGRPITGERLKTSGPTFEIYVAGAGGDRQLRVVLSTTTGGAFGELKAALETLTVTPRPRGPEFEARLKTAAGVELGTATAQLDQPFSIAGEQLTVARRKTVREQRRGVRFEHDPGLVMIDAGTSAPALMLRQGDVTIQLMVPPGHMDPADVAAAGGMLTGATPFTRTIAGVGYDGVRGTFAMGDVTVATQILAFDRGGRSFVVLTQSPAPQADAAAGLADAIVATAH